MKYKGRLLCLALLVLLFCAASAEVRAENNVNIQIKEFQRDKEGNEIPYQDPKTGILPGDTISKVVYVCNEGDCARIRIKPSVEGPDGQVPEEMPGELTGISPDWEKREDGWYYYTGILRKGQRAKFSEGFVIGDLDQAAWTLRTFRLVFTAEAVSCGGGKTAPATGDGSITPFVWAVILGGAAFAAAAAARKLS